MIEKKPFDVSDQATPTGSPEVEEYITQEEYLEQRDAFIRKAVGALHAQTYQRGLDELTAAEQEIAAMGFPTDVLESFKQVVTVERHKIAMATIKDVLPILADETRADQKL